MILDAYTAERNKQIHVDTDLDLEFYRRIVRESFELLVQILLNRLP